MAAHPHQALNPFKGLTDADGRELSDPKRTNFHRKRLGSQAQTSATGTRNKLKEFFKFLPLRLSTGITKLTLKNR